MYPGLPEKTPALWRGAIVFSLVALLLASAGCATHRRNHITVESSRRTPSIWPISGASIRITSRFGDHVSTGRGTGHTHIGIDLAAPKGTPVLAAADGAVLTVGNAKGGYGRFVKVAHGGGIETLYAHLSSIEASEGERVRQGQCIGRVGMTGHATGNHLHYEVRVNGVAVDPIRYLPSQSRR